MPGLNQLKEFSKELLSLGDETTIRKKRGEPVRKIKLPRGVSQRDDSDDFLLGLLPDENAALAEKNAPTVDEASNEVDYDALASDLFNSQADAETDVENLLSNIYSKDSSSPLSPESENTNTEPPIPSIVEDVADTQVDSQGEASEEQTPSSDIEIPIPDIQDDSEPLAPPEPLVS
ncbi:MAG: periplasmic-type flagellar collar protein FlcA, partial [Phocaeicola sp.]